MKILLFALLALTIVQQDPYRVPDDPNDESPSHFHRPDGKNCSLSGDHPCHCGLRSCQKDKDDNLTDWEPNSKCQNYCTKGKCTCHHCPELSECPQ